MTAIYRRSPSKQSKSVERGRAGESSGRGGGSICGVSVTRSLCRRRLGGGYVLRLVFHAYLCMPYARKKFVIDVSRRQRCTITFKFLL